LYLDFEEWFKFRVHTSKRSYRFHDVEKSKKMLQKRTSQRRNPHTGFNCTKKSLKVVKIAQIGMKFSRNRKCLKNKIIEQ
jgi:hypothetical protein